MLLYDTIYVLEFEYMYCKHICVCTLCLHAKYPKILHHLEMYKKHSNYNYNILKITYPRTCYDLINGADIDTDYKELLCNLAYSPITIVNNTLQTSRYIGVSDLHDILYKKLNIEYGIKKVFLYTY